MLQAGHCSGSRWEAVRQGSSAGCKEHVGAGREAARCDAVFLTHSSSGTPRCACAEEGAAQGVRLSSLFSRGPAGELRPVLEELRVPVRAVVLPLLDPQVARCAHACVRAALDPSGTRKHLLGTCAAARLQPALLPTLCTTAVCRLFAISPPQRARGVGAAPPGAAAAAQRAVGAGQQDVSLNHLARLHTHGAPALPGWEASMAGGAPEPCRGAAAAPPTTSSEPRHWLPQTAAAAAPSGLLSACPVPPPSCAGSGACHPC